jgi:hypothetical protein
MFCRFYVFDVLVRDLTADEERWIKGKCEGDTGEFIYEFISEYNEVITRFYWPKGRVWPYEDDVREYQEEAAPFRDFEWDVLKWKEGNRDLRIRDTYAEEPPLLAAELIRRFFKKWRPKDTFSLKYSSVSSNDDRSLGAFHITAERVEWMSVEHWLMEREKAWRPESGQLRC